ncbi:MULTISPECIES: phage tail tape measure protein [unclassified Pseudomonas]|uniref:phage tail tape measure protein n=1 Tax=unclassified Pseudomonas TaxID=196821 RepID=UPI0018E87D0F|nr:MULTISPECIES: phage tail tape measure protein [unclassified Pseudomonas]MBJ2303846.1 phage tail tape measure protein [Pseudomonas sp. MF2846]MBK3492289.1 phage tail tape measure protein [Pseudomonas sp. MF2857]
MSQTSRLVLEIDSRNAEQKAADTRKALEALESQGLRAPVSLRKTSDSIKQVGISSAEATVSVRGMERQVRTLASMAAGIAGPLAAAFSVAKIAKASEEYTNLTNRLRLVTDGTQQLAKSQQDVFRVAQDSRQALDTTAQVYQRIAQNGKQLGLTLDQVASVTETVAKTVALSGASTQAADAAMVQFGQALASGTLRGDELNSIMEQTPALAQAIARGLGVTIGELRTLGSEGKLTSEAIVTALQNQKGKVDELSSSLQVTAGQAITAFNNSLVVTIGKLDQATTASSKFAQGVLSLSKAMDGFNSGEFLDFFRDDKQTVSGLNSQLSVTMAQMRDLGDLRAKLIKGQPGDTVFYKFKLYDVGALDKEISDLESKARGITSITKKMQADSAKIGNQSPAGDARSTPVNPAYEKLLKNLKEQAALQGQNSEAAKVRYAIESGELGKLLPAQSALLLKYAEEKDAKVAAAEATKKLGSYTEDAGMKALDQARQQYAVLKEQNSLIGVQKGEVDKLGAAGQALIKWEQELADIKTKKTLTADQKSLVANQELITAQLKKNAALEKEGALRKIANDETQKLAAFQTNLASQLSKAQIGLDNNLAGMGMGDQMRQRLQEQLSIQQQYQTQLDTLEQQHNEGRISDSLYGKETEALRAALQQRLTMQQGYYSAVDQAQSDWSLGASSALQTYAEQANDVAGQTRNLFTNAFGNMEDAVVNFVKTGKLSFKDFADGVVADLIRIQVRQAAAGFLGMAFGAITGGGGAALGPAVMTGSSQTISRVGFSGGGYTGDGGKFEPKGVVHGGEFVVKKEVVSQPGAREFLERMNANSNGYADGGYVNPTPAAASSSTTQSIATNGGSPTITQQFSFQGNPDDATISLVKDAAYQGAKGGYEMVMRDLKQNGPIRQLIARR